MISNFELVRFYSGSKGLRTGIWMTTAAKKLCPPWKEKMSTWKKLSLELPKKRFENMYKYALNQKEKKNMI